MTRYYTKLLLTTLIFSISCFAETLPSDERQAETIELKYADNLSTDVRAAFSKRLKQEGISDILADPTGFIEINEVVLESYKNKPTKISVFCPENNFRNKYIPTIASYLKLRKQYFPKETYIINQLWFEIFPKTVQKEIKTIDGLIITGLEAGIGQPQPILYINSENCIDAEEEEQVPEEEPEIYAEPTIKGYVFSYSGADADEYKNTECLIYDAAIDNGVLTEVIRESHEQVLKHLKEFKDPKIYLCSAVYNNLSEELKAQLRTLGYSQSHKRPFIPIYQGGELRLLMVYTDLNEHDKWELKNGFNRLTVLLKDIRRQYPNMAIRIPRVLFEAFPIEYQKSFGDAGYQGAMLELI